MCLNPVYKNFNGRRVFVPCGKCMECVAQRASEWTFRLVEESRRATCTLFTTLTYNDLCIKTKYADGYYPLCEFGIIEPNVYGVTDRYGDKHYPTICHADITSYLDRLRKRLGYRSLRYFIAPEYGGITYRPHYHCIFFYYGTDLQEFYLALSEEWTQGFVQSPAVLNSRNAHYCAKYCTKSPLADFDPTSYGCDVCRTRVSQNIGSAYLKNKKYHVAHRSLDDVLNNRYPNQVTTPDGFNTTLPRYYYRKWFCERKQSELNPKNYYYVSKSYVYRAEERITQLGFQLNPDPSKATLEYAKQRMEQKKHKYELALKKFRESQHRKEKQYQATLKRKQNGKQEEN